MRKLRMGMIGGGSGAFIGVIHRIAAIMDGEIELVCGALSSDPTKSKESGKDLNVDPSRVYDSYQEMISKEKELPDDVRMDFVSIVTPNNVHFEPAKLAMENGFHVVLDKPMTLTLQEAKQLREVLQKTGRYFCLTHTYTGYPMVKEARVQVQKGKIGNIRKILVTYPQGWLSSFVEGASDNKQASWRTDPSKSGIAGGMGDIGTHAFNLAEYISGLKVTRMLADLHIVVEGRKLDDDGAVLLKFNNGATGVLIASQVMAGEENDFHIKIYGDQGGLKWYQLDPNSLIFIAPGKPIETWRSGTSYLSAVAKHNTRITAGHPEGYIEAFANHYRNFALCLKAHLAGEKPKEEWLDFPGIEDGVRGMAFIENVIASSRSQDRWTEFKV